MFDGIIDQPTMLWDIFVVFLAIANMILSSEAVDVHFEIKNWLEINDLERLIDSSTFANT